LLQHLYRQLAKQIRRRLIERIDDDELANKETQSQRALLSNDQVLRWLLRFQTIAFALSSLHFRNCKTAFLSAERPTIGLTAKQVFANWRQMTITVRSERITSEPMVNQNTYILEHKLEH
jgi:hypothetical protein